MLDLLAVVPLVGRERLAAERLHGRRLIDLAVEVASAHARRVLIVTASAPSEPHVEPNAEWGSRVGLVALPADRQAFDSALAVAERVMIHDPLCPLIPPAFVERAIAAANAVETVIAVRPVVDTVKQTADAVIESTLDRDRLRVVSSPVVTTAAALAALDDPESSLRDLAELAVRLRAAGGAQLLSAPSAGRRIEDLSGLRLMASIDAVGARTRERQRPPG